MPAGNGWWCCCSHGCLEVRDDFDRADSTDLGSNWDECTGDWEILSEQLVANESGIVTWLHMDGDQVGAFTLYAKDIAVDTILSIRAFYGSVLDPCLETSSWRLRFTALTSTTGKLELLDASNTVVQYQNFSAITTGAGSYLAMVLCVGPERIDGTSTASNHLLSCLCTDALPSSDCTRAGIWFAIENESEETVKIEWVYYIDHKSHDSSCPDCMCGCDGHCFPDTLYATLRDFDMCANQEGKQFTLTKRADSCIWEMDEETWDGCTIQLQLVSGAGREYDGLSEWSLNDLSSSTSFEPETGSTCDPVFLEFAITGGGTKNSTDYPACGSGGVWSCCDGDCTPPCPYAGASVCQGSYYIEITE